MTRAESEARWQHVADLYREGMKVADIGRAIGLDTGCTHRLIWQMRRAGWDLPHRQVHRPRDRHAA